MMEQAQLTVLASLLPTLRLSTMRTLLQFKDYLYDEAAELVLAEMQERGKQIKVDRGDWEK